MRPVLALLALLALAATAPPSAAMLVFDPFATADHASGSADRQANETWRSADEAAGLPSLGPPASDAVPPCFEYHAMNGVTGQGMSGAVCPDDALPDGVVDEAGPGDATDGDAPATPDGQPSASGAAPDGTPEPGTVSLPGQEAPSIEAQAEDAPIRPVPQDAEGNDPAAPPPASDGPSPAEERRLRAWAAAALATAVLLPSALVAIALKLASLLGLPWRSRDRAESPVVAAILALVAAEPGMHHMDLVRRLGKGNGTVEHHVRRLVAARRLARIQTAGYTCYVLPDADPRVAAAQAALRSRTSRRVAEAAAGAPTTLSQVAAALGLAVSTVHYHAGRLAEAGVLEGTRRGAGRSLALTEAGRACLGLAIPAAAPPGQLVQGVKA